MIAVHEAVVAGRFNALCGRFKREVAPDDARLVAIVERLSPLEGRRVLDLGCGKGRFARSLIERGADVVGLDLSAGMLSEAAGFTRVRGSARRLPFCRASFDAVLAVEVFEHLAPEAIDRVCGEVLRVLEPGGTFVVIDKNAWSWNARRPWLPSVAVKWLDERRGLWMYGQGDPVRERWFRPRELKRRLGRSFPLVRVWHLLSRAEMGRFPFQWLPFTRLMVLWAATAPGGPT
jgi:SAM-dependent methyltransferase